MPRCARHDTSIRVRDPVSLTRVPELTGNLSLEIILMKILVIVEQREGKLNRVSFETLTGAQAIARETGWTLEAAVVGSGVGEIAREIAGKKVARVYDIESPQLAAYTPDAFVA